MGSGMGRMYWRYCLAPGAPRLWAPALLAFLAFGVGCRSSVESVQLGIAPSAEWRAAPIGSGNVPGTPVAAWSGPQGASLVAYTALPMPRGTAAGVSEDLANRLTNLPGLRVVERRTETWDG